MKTMIYKTFLSTSSRGYKGTKEGKSTASWAAWSIIMVMLAFALSPTYTWAQCSVQINNLTVSRCYQSAGSSKASVSVEVAWANAPSGQNIVVTGPAGSSPSTITIKPGANSIVYPGPPVINGTQTIVSPQIVAFEIPANGSTGLNITAAFSGTPSCNATSSNFNAPANCTPTTCASGGLGGQVFFDFNANGIKEVTEARNGRANTTVTIIDVNGITYSANTDRFGFWTASVPAGSYPVRVEFSGLGGFRQGTPVGTDGNTTVQFVNAPNCNVDLGVLDNSLFVQNMPPVVVPIFVNGDPLTGGANSSIDAFVSFDYNASGAKDPSKITTLATTAQVGSLWGVAYNKNTKRVFTSATLKRHVGLGPEGLGGIYVINPYGTAGSTLIASWDVTTDFGINVGTIPSNSARGLSDGLTDSSRDPDAFSGIGKVGIGDLEISTNGNTLYFTNLFDNKLYAIDITAYNTSGTKPTIANVTSFNIPDPGCNGGNFRPWALKILGNNIYVGAVCDAATSQNKSDLRGFVYRYNIPGNTWSTDFDFPLTYPKGFPTADQPDNTGWYPWTDDWDQIITANSARSGSEIAYSQPMFTDIEFDIDGSMVLGFGDRGGMQLGYRNLSPTTGSSLWSGFIGGDILMAYFDGSVKYILENNAKVGPFNGYGANNKQGPGLGEYFNDDYFNGSGNLRHAECVIGGLAIANGTGELLTTTIDPVNGINWAGGVRHYDTESGITNYGFTLYRTTAGDAATLAKAAGLGDLEILADVPTYIEIGNRVWIDTNQDGIQDPNENPLPGVKVSLYKGSTKIAETTTNTLGEYYFSSKSRNITPALWTGTGADTTLLPTTSYALVFGETQFAANQLTIGSDKYSLTTANTATGLGNDFNDSDATIVSNFPTISLNSPVSGAVNHSFDAGFIPALSCTTPSAPVLSVTNNTCTPVAAGSINVVTACGSGTYIEYSTNNGTSWSTTAPPYGTSAITVIARCVNSTNLSCFSANSAPVTTAPIVCPTPTPCPDPNCGGVTIQKN